MKEIWKDIKCYEGTHQASNYGRVKSLERKVSGKNGSIRTIKEKILKPHLCKGYYQIRMQTGKKYSCLLLHKLIAQTFIPNPNNYETVHHIDHNPKNNKIDNLVWMSKEEHDKLHKNEQSIKVYQYTLGNELVAIWPSASEAAKELGFAQSDIWKCCTGERKTHKGYKWSYIPL